MSDRFILFDIGVLLRLEFDMIRSPMPGFGPNVCAIPGTLRKRKPPA
jgi:hypothetical protein